ncbi:MAG: deoxyribonuclease V [Thiohalomonadaceae bacterium]|jgi:deoxyribonuclease V
MLVKLEHAWDVTPAAARALQQELRGRVVLADRLGKPGCVAGIDVGLEEKNTIARAAVVVLSFPQLELIESSIARQPVQFPYIPGLLSFREIPVILAALDGLRERPDLLLCDGQGIAHPRRFGIASHLGVLYDIPAIGVGKSRLLGSHAQVPDQRGAWMPLRDGDEIIGAVLRTRRGVKPLFISAGHRISLPTAVYYTLACTTRYRLPETTRQAHYLASLAWRKGTQ